ncbi:hypothetical protein AB0C29_18300 [Actinoplanes sp. NPDC048791]|uniref:hypothetical protein n=1 Tax=Actinoplanes sp. NPDC048791 TaxID=3154623 RepID=UPI0033E4A717
MAGPVDGVWVVDAGLRFPASAWAAAAMEEGRSSGGVTWRRGRPPGPLLWSSAPCSARSEVVGVEPASLAAA